jgi:hypothetical protein
MHPDDIAKGLALDALDARLFPALIANPRRDPTAEARKFADFWLYLVAKEIGAKASVRPERRGAAAGDRARTKTGAHFS